MQVTPGSTVSVELTHLTADCDLYVYGSQGQLIGVSNNGGTSDESLTGVLRNSTYYAKIKGYSGAECSYTLTYTSN